jgi:eukaryotic-like serine/threonine-protein kinase
MITTEIRTGSRLGDRYRVIRRLGAGGMATVWLAEDDRLGREVAIKRLKTDAPEEALTRFRREARLGAALNHPNLVSVFDTMATDEGALIVMEYVPGRSLEDLRGESPVDPAEAISILRGVAGALDHAHRQGVVHRDIKPANVLVREDGTVKVADLGIARAVDATQITAEGKAIGTVPYMAPERFEGPGTGGPESDVFALAAVAYELLSGSPLDVENAVHGSPPERRDLARGWPGAPAAIFSVIERGLSGDPARRQRSAGELVDELEDALQRGDEETLPVDVRPRTGPVDPPRLRVSAASPRAARPPSLGTRYSTGSRSRRPSRGAALALTLLALAVLTATGIALVGGGSGDGSGQSGKKKDASAAHAPRTDGSAAADPSGSSSPGVAPASSESSAPAAGSVDGATLNAEGFSLINQGRAAEAVPILRQAVDAYPESSTDLSYAYALYNLGHALRLSGQPDEAIPILERRLRIPDQQSTVAAELARARAEAGD